MTDVWPFLPTSYTGSGNMVALLYRTSGSLLILSAAEAEAFEDVCCDDRGDCWKWLPPWPPPWLSTYGPPDMEEEELLLVTLFALLSLLALLLAWLGSLKPLMETVVVDEADVLDLGAGWGAPVVPEPPVEKETTPSDPTWWW